MVVLSVTLTSARKSFLVKTEMDSTSWTTRKITASSSDKHGGNDMAKYADIINMSCEMPGDAHKFWIKEPAGCKNQGPEAALTMMHHALRKVASALLCEGVQVTFNLNIFKYT